jgi:hypothetical protein
MAKPVKHGDKRRPLRDERRLRTMARLSSTSLPAADDGARASMCTSSGAHWSRTELLFQRFQDQSVPADAQRLRARVYALEERVGNVDRPGHE